MSGLRSTLLLLAFATLLVGGPSAVAQDEPNADAAAEVEVEQPTLPRQMTTKATTVLVVYCVLILAGSIVGGWLPSLVNLTHNRMQLIISLIGGLMLGIGLFHMLPHALAQLSSASLPNSGAHAVDVNQVNTVMIWMMTGLVFMFFLLRMFHFHQHELPDAHDHSAHDHDHDCTHPHAHQDHNVHKLSWLGVFIGLAIHTLVDGLALGASIRGDLIYGDYWLPFGMGTFLAILLHKPLDAVSITSLMKAAGWSTGWQTLVNVGFALMCPLGAILFFVGLSQFTGNQGLVIGCALAFSAGVFVCISLSDLLPEMEFHSHSRIPLSIALLLGIAVAWSLTLLEPHNHNRRQSQIQSQTQPAAE